MSIRSRKIYLGLLTLVLIVAAALVGISVSPPGPECPLFEGRRLSVWMDLYRNEQISEARWRQILDGLGAEAVPWLIWRAQHDPQRASSTHFQALVERVRSQIAGLSANSYDANLTAWDALSKLGPKASAAIPAAISALGSPVMEERINAALFLGNADREKQLSKEALIRMTADPRFECRTAAAVALGQFGVESPSVVAQLVTQAQGVTFPFRLIGILNLERIGPAAKSALPALRAIAEGDPDSGIRDSAQRAIQAIER